MECKNCQLLLKSEDNYCNNCGAKVITKRISFRTLWEEFSDRVLNLENHFFRTFKHLFTQPEAVIDGYIYGMRKKYITAFGYFVVSITLAGLYTFIFNEFFSDDFLKDAQSFGGRTDIDATKKIMDFTGKYQSMIAFINIPILALIQKLVFYNYKKYNFTEIVVIYLYAFSHYNIIIYAINVFFLWNASLSMIVSTISSMMLVFYIAYVLKRLYGLNAEKIVLKTLLFFVVGGILLGLLSIVAGFIMYKTGVFDSLIEAAKQAAEAEKNK